MKTNKDMIRNIEQEQDRLLRRLVLLRRNKLHKSELAKSIAKQIMDYDIALRALKGTR